MCILYITKQFWTMQIKQIVFMVIKLNHNTFDLCLQILFLQLCWVKFLELTIRAVDNDTDFEINIRKSNVFFSDLILIIINN